MRFFDERPTNNVAALVVVLTVAAGIASCAGASAGERRATGRDDRGALVVVQGAPEGALVSVDGTPAHVVAPGRPGFVVAPGRHRLEVSAEGHLPFRYDGEFADGDVYDLSVELWPCFVGVDTECEPPGEAPR